MNSLVKKNDIKILVISHNVFSKTSSMGRTLANFFIDTPKENIAQLYFHSEVPTTDVCENYFRITDFEILKKSKKNIGNVFSKEDIRKELKSERIDVGVEAKIYSFGRQRKPYMYIGRNLLWASKKWKNEKLRKWIDEFNPDVIFFASGDYVFPYRIAIDIANERNIPIVTYVCDDYYFLNAKSISPLYYLNRFWYKRTLKGLFHKHNKLVAICNKISYDYRKEFGVEAETVMTSSQLSRFEDKPDGSELKISYIGNMGYKRHIPLVEIGQSLKEITDNKIMLDVYSAENRPEILSELNEQNGIRFKGSIPYNKVVEVMNDSDILVHVESMDELCRKKVRYSVSTKIADSLSCGRCLFAYGPSDVASIEYLMENDCACVVTDKNELRVALTKLIEDDLYRKLLADKAVTVSKDNHNKSVNGEKIQNIVNFIENR